MQAFNEAEGNMRFIALIVICLAMTTAITPVMPAEAAGARIDGNGVP
jgi:hypothetical protein